jgi:Concanavalin A-like lectin/glucanases superfamily
VPPWRLRRPLASTYDGTQVLLYVNGVVVAATPCTGNFPAETTPVILGGNGNNRQVTELFPGLVDEMIVLYNRALTADEVQQLADGVSF